MLIKTAMLETTPFSPVPKNVCYRPALKTHPIVFFQSESVLSVSTATRQSDIIQRRTSGASWTHGPCPAPAQSCGREVGREAGLGRRGSQAHPHENTEEMVALLAKQK